MADTISTHGYYWGYKTEVTVIHSGDKLVFATENHVDIDYEINSSDGGDPATNTVTLYNISKSNQSKIHKGDHVVVKTGPTDVYGIISEGDITNILPEVIDNADKSFQITFLEGPNYTGKVNITFKKGVKASQIIDRIKRSTKIKISTCHLKNNKVYQRGYTVSNKPVDAIKSITKDCGSSMYYRQGALVIDDGAGPNPYNENLYVEMANGLTAEPTYDASDDGDSTYTLECFDDPRLMAGSAVYVKSNSVIGLKRVKSVMHKHDQSTYDMEVVVRA